MLPTWLDVDTIRWLAIAAIVLVLVGMVLVANFVRHLIFRITLLLLLGVFGLLVWVERDNLEGCARDCSCEVLGFEVHVPPETNPLCT